MSSQRLPGQPGRFGQPDELVRRIERIEATLRELGPSIAKSFAGTVATLQQAVDDIAQAQDTLSDAVDDINEVIGEQVAFITDETHDSLFPMPVGVTTALVSSNITVPAGYTQMSVLTVGFVAGTNNSGAGGYLYSQISVDGANVSELLSGLYTDNGSYSVSYVSAAHSQAVTPGETITTTLRGKGDFAAWGSASTYANISVVYLFSR